MSESNCAGAGREALAVVAVDQRAPVLRRAAGRPAPGRRPARRASSPRGAQPHGRRRRARTRARRAHGSAIGSCATTAPSIRTSPSGRYGSRTKKPATIASGWPLAAHQWSSRVGSAKRCTRTRVARERVADEVDGRLLAVARAEPQQLVVDVEYRPSLDDANVRRARRAARGPPAAPRQGPLHRRLRAARRARGVRPLRLRARAHHRHRRLRRARRRRRATRSTPTTTSTGRSPSRCR